MSACMHKVHQTAMVAFRFQGKPKSDSIAVSQGLNEAAQRWELCDRGLLIQREERMRRRKRAHSAPRKTSKRNRTSEEE